MKIEFNRYSSEAIDQIINSILIDDYNMVRDEVRRLKNVLKKQESDSALYKVYQEDLKFNKKVKKAYATILRYSLPYEEANDLLGVEKCKTDGQ